MPSEARTEEAHLATTTGRPGPLPFPARRLPKPSAPRRDGVLDDIVGARSSNLVFVAAFALVLALPSTGRITDHWDPLDVLRFALGTSTALFLLLASGLVSLNWAMRRVREPGPPWLRACRFLMAAAPALLVAPVIHLTRESVGGTVELMRLGPAERPRVEAFPTGGAVMVEGTYVPGMTRRLAHVLDRHPGIRTVVLESPGGDAAEGLAMAELIRARGLDTLAFSTCFSSCSVAFVAGRTRKLAAWKGFAAKVGFHSTSRGGAAFDDPALRANYLRSGLRAGFVDRAVATPPWEILVPGPGELMAANAADAVVGPLDVPGWLWGENAPGAARVLAMTDARFWMVAALARHAPGAAARARAWHAATFDDARNGSLADERLGGALARIVAGSLARAPDRIVNRAGLQILSGMLAARDASGSNCRRIGAYADLRLARISAPSPMGGGYVSGDPYVRLVEDAFEAAPPSNGTLADLRPAEDGDGWDARSMRPVPAEGCAELIAWYRDAVDFSHGGTDRLRARFKAATDGAVEPSSGG
jgi:hypothetical protein